MSVVKGGGEREEKHVGPGDKRYITTLANCSGWSSSVFGGGSYPLVPNIERKIREVLNAAGEKKEREKRNGEKKKDNSSRRKRKPYGPLDDA